MFWLTSERLGLRRFTADDLDVVADLYGDPEVARYIGGTLDRSGAEGLLHGRILDYYDRHPGLGIWAGVELATGKCTGMHLLNHVHGEPDIQVGYAMFKSFWGRGYATEMAVRLLHHGFDDVGLKKIVAITDVAHVVSQRVLEKSGLRRHGERLLPHPMYAKSGPLAWFEREAADWLAEHAGRGHSSPST